MPTFVRSLLKMLGRAALWLLGIFIALLILVLVVAPAIEKADRNVREQKAAQADKRKREWDEGWKKWWDEHQTVDNGGKQPSNRSKPKEPSAPGTEEGFSFGYLAAKLAAANGATKPSSTEVDKLARAAAAKQSVLPNAREAWVSGFKAGWPFGWKDGR
jgi:hypothetical protein